MPLKASNLIGAIGGIGELAKSAFGGDDKAVLPATKVRKKG